MHQTLRSNPLLRSILVIGALTFAACSDDDGGAITAGTDNDTTTSITADPTDEPSGEGDGDPARLGTIEVSMTGAAEVPGPGATDVDPVDATINLGDSEICVAADFTSLGAPVSGLHIHEAAVDAAGGVVIDLGSTLNEAGTAADGCVSSDKISDVEANPAGFYLNAHTADFPAGAVRAQLG